MGTRFHYRTTLAATALVLVALGAVPSHAQGRFGLFANAFLDSSRTPKTRITVEVPFRTLVFFKKEGFFDSRYEAFISILDTSKPNAPPSTYVLHGFATVKSYDETRRRDQKSRADKEFDLPPGQYTITARLTVQNTQISLEHSVTLRVPNFLASGMGIGTPEVLSVPPGISTGLARWADVASRAGGTRLGKGGAISGLNQSPAVRFSVFLKEDITDAMPCDIYYEAVDASGHEILYGKRRVELKGRNDDFLLTLDADDWSPGLYQVNLRAQTQKPERDASASVDVRLDITRAMLGANFDQTLEILSLIASQEELKPLRDAPESERAAAWNKFWAARDPDPSTPENEALTQYLQRLQYVDKEFSQFGPGWRSDRGRIYIRYGPPEQIDTSMDQGSSEGEYEIWRYYSLNRTFVFYDMFGVGDYKLVQGGP